MAKNNGTVVVKATATDGSGISGTLSVTISNQVVLPSIVFGCTDPAALNYNSKATKYDGSCIYTTIKYGCTDSKALNFDSTATVNNGTCVYSQTIAGCIDAKALNYNANATVSDGSCKYDTTIWGCMDPKATNFNAKANKDNGLCEYVTVIKGCTDILATNYVPYATYDDGSCQYKQTDIYGCTDKAALNYNSFATVNNNTCIYRVVTDTIRGCMDAMAINYNPVATISGTCIYSAPVVKGCTSATAVNYNPLAVEDDGTCVYAPPINTFKPVIKDEIIKDTLGSKPVSDCSLNSAVPIDSAFISNLTMSGSTEATVTWKIWQGGISHSIIVKYKINQNGDMLFNLSLICSTSNLKSTKNDKLKTFTVQALYNVNSATGISEHMGIADFKTFPNPCSTMLYFEFENNDVSVITIRSITGMVVIQKVLSMQANTVQVDLSGLSNGLYMAEIKFRNGTVVNRKLVKQ
jgi:hypothetical protein